MEADRSFFPVDVSYLRYGSFPETALKLPLQQKMFFSPAWLSIYAVYFHRRIYERKPFEKTSLLPVGLFRDTFSDKRCDPSGLCTALVRNRIIFRKNTQKTLLKNIHGYYMILRRITKKVPEPTKYGGMK